MSLPASASDRSPLTHHGVRFVPVVHGRLEFAWEVRRQILAWRPDVVAVEFPVTLRDAIERGVKRLTLLSVVSYTEADDGEVFALVEPTDGVIEAVRTARELGIPRAYVDRDTEGYPQTWESFPDVYGAQRIGHAAYCAAFAELFDPAAERDEEDRLREETMAARLQELAERHDRVLFAGGLYHYPAVAHGLGAPRPLPLGRVRRDGVAIEHLHEDSSRELLTDFAWLARAYEDARAGADGAGAQPAALDRLILNERLVEEARAQHLENAGERLTPHQRRVVFQFARNQALLRNGLVPDLYELVVAARGAADDNYAWEVWDLATTYPWQTETPELAVRRLRWEDLLKASRRVRFRRRLPKTRRRLVPVPVRQRPRERHPGEWRDLWHGGHIVSYPPEDLVVEGYGSYLKKKALDVLSEEVQQVVPFTTSLLDGLDIRETLRNWHEGRIYVKENRPTRGRVGSVVVIFDEDLPAGQRTGYGDHYPWLLSWLGEHSQESDMALYATPPEGHIVGPGVSRCEYGGFMMSTPPLRLHDVWHDETFDAAATKSERLLLAALDYSVESYVVYVAAQPPRSRVKSVAERMGKKVIYLPIGQLSPKSIQQIRVFHVLDGMPIRAWARHYVW